MLCRSRTRAILANTETKKEKLGKLVGAKRERKQVFYLGGISLECSAEDISSFCGDHCYLIDCRIILSRRHGTQAARIVVGESEGKVLESLTWPKHLYLRRWNFDTTQLKPESSRNQSLPVDTEVVENDHCN